jgi:hypothetical protein
MYVGAASRFDVMKIDLDVGNIGGSFVWEYFNGSAWVLLPIASDSTNFMRQSGIVTFAKPADWRDTLVNGVRKFWLRLRVTVPTVVQTATIFEIKTAPLPGVVYLVAMDAAATLPSSLQTAVSNAVELFRAAGIRVSVRPPFLTMVPFSIIVQTDPLADTTTLKATLTTSIANFLSTFKLSRELVLSELVQFIRNQSSSIVDVTILTPTANIDASFDEVLRAGTINITITQ